MARADTGIASGLEANGRKPGMLCVHRGYLEAEWMRMASVAQRSAFAPGIGAADQPVGRHDDALQPAREFEQAHFMSHRFERRLERLGGGAPLKLRCAAPAAEIGQVDRL